MLSELIIYIIVFFYGYFKTSVPYKWDFCGLKFERRTKLLINYGSYYIVYAAFIYWFVQYALRWMRNLRGKSRFLAYMILISAATKVFWRLFLLATYFFTGSFYPWCTASTVIFLNFPSALIVLTSIGKGLQLVFQGFIEFVKLFNFESVTRSHSSSQQSAATKVFCRLFLLATYFFTGSFYPWCTASTVIFLNFPSALIVLTSIGKGLQLVFQGFIEFVKLFNFESVTRSHSSSQQSAGRTQTSLLDARIFDSTEAQPIVSGYSGESRDHSEYAFVISPPGTRIHDGERSQASSEATVSSEYFSGIRILPPPDANGFHEPGDFLPLSRSSEHRELRLLTETVTPVQKRVTPRQPESIPSTSAIYYPYPSQQSHNKDETPGVSKLSSISKLGQLAPKQNKEIRTEELDEGDKVSKRKVTTEGKIRSTRKEKNRMGVFESTAGIHRENNQDFTYRTRSGLIYGLQKR